MKKSTEENSLTVGGVILSAGNLNDFSWLRGLSSAIGIELIEADEIPLSAVLTSIPVADLQMVVFQSGSKSGMNLINYITNKANEIRKVVPGLGIGIIGFGSAMPFNYKLLPPRVWFIYEQTNPSSLVQMIEDSRNAKKDLIDSLRPFEVYPDPPASKKRTIRQIEHTLPNFNIKHSGMLVPIAHAAIEAQTPTFVEISAQEALAYYNQVGHDCKTKVEEAFKQLRKDVDLVNQKLNSEIYLHLDHCSDPDLIYAALDCGFDSIMADRSTATLRDNIRFVQQAKAIADKYGVPTEGEIGAIDLHGFSKKSTTILDEAFVFVKETGVDFVGINAGQYHSGDYGYDRARLASREYQDLRDRNVDEDINLVDACIKIDSEISARGLREDFELRKSINDLVSSIIYNDNTDCAILLNNFERNMSVANMHWTQKIRLLWGTHNLESQQKLTKFYSQITSNPVKHDNKENKMMSFDILAEMAEWLSANSKDTRMVLHGGSSIDSNDLQFFSIFNIARVNLGSTPYLMYIDALKSSQVSMYDPKQELSNEASISFLNEYGKNWKEWLDNYPAFLRNCQYELYTKYFKPFIT